MGPWVELSWMFVIITVSSRLATIRARLMEKKTSAGDNGRQNSRKKKNNNR